MSLRSLKEHSTTALIWTISGAVTLLTVLVIVALTHRSLPILSKYPLTELLCTSAWRPMRGEFGFEPFIVGTLWVTVLAMVLSAPMCLLTAMFLAEYARPGTRAWIKPLVDVLAGIPSVVYGVVGVLVIVPFIKDYVAPRAAKSLAFIPGLSIEGYATGYCVLAGGIVLAIMVAPVIISVAEEVLRAVPLGVREASLALGATRWETVKHVTLRGALPGLIGAVVLGFSRAFGETMAVLMVVGNVAKSPRSLFDPAYPLPALIANNYGEMMSIPLYDSALLFAALLLLLMVLFFNFLGQVVLMKARRRCQQ